MNRWPFLKLKASDFPFDYNPYSPNTVEGTIVEKAPLICPKCNVSTYYCPCSLARLEALRKSTREAIRIASKPRARLIKAFSIRSAWRNTADYPTRDTWMVHKEFNGRIVRGYGYELDGALLDYMNMLSIAKNVWMRDRARWES
jgi:hypothetical protein